ncbi:DMT family transporter [Marinomonas sp. M1K-6]|uniref:DMT family transporter n=1 Tax=Marinomonas profundi TaxID=2726122 RepID=A0A847R4E6_9GAMM|nr:DMT family transporter [Marinomonas profundi]NLQ18865.1 DMT family transporter [Marinomonas profundi]UDV01792.1 DMT family transporter [Marinomonas profundi]
MLTAKQTFLYGLFFSSITVLFWGMLPIALKLSSGFSDPITLTWLRFSVAGILLGLWQWQRGKLGEFKSLVKKDWLRLFTAGTFLIVNYTCFAWSLDFLLPGSAQLSFQVAPLFLALGGLFFLKESIHWQQWLCFVGIGLGMLVFFHPIFGLGGQGSIWLGFAIVQLSAAAWSLYALLQKSLFKRLAPSNILLAVYLYALLVMLPFSSPSELLNMSSDEAWIAAFCCLNTLIAYGAFAQAMRYWQTVQVSASVALTPVMAFILTELCVALGWWTGSISSSHADLLSLLGMLIVIVSAINVQWISARAQRKAALLSKPLSNVA